jgi:hypothetical protein
MADGHTDILHNIIRHRKNTVENKNKKKMEKKRKRKCQ